jgi:peptidoglycan/xylan/chitin deacetylase (PgdA/CDA1 family)
MTMGKLAHVTSFDSGGLRRRTVLAAFTALGAAAAGGCDTTSGPPASGSSSPPGSGLVSPPTSSPASPATSSPPALPTEVVHGPRDTPAVALTFHGQGDATVVGRLLDALAAADARVTVLAVGVWLEQQPALAKRILDAGHELGNHTQHHADIKAMRDPEAFAEISDCAAALRRLTGSIGRWFRPSQTQHSTPMIRAQAARVGYGTCLSYDVDSLDYTNPGAAAVVRTTLHGVQNGSIVSLHFGHPGTVTAIPDLVAGLHTRGLRPVTMTELVG